MDTTPHCPDGGTCHHECQPHRCFRVQYCGPFSNVYPGDDWPTELREHHGVKVPSRPPRLIWVPLYRPDGCAGGALGGVVLMFFNNDWLNIETGQWWREIITNAIELVPGPSFEG